MSDRDLSRAINEGSFVRPIDFVSLNSRLESNQEEKDIQVLGVGRGVDGFNPMTPILAGTRTWSLPLAEEQTRSRAALANNAQGAHKSELVHCGSDVGAVIYHRVY